jgi:phosphoribosylamine--glycine ligase
MKILVVGSGGREHAICWAFSRGNGRKIFCADGNAGIADIAKCVNIKPHEIGKLLEFAAIEGIDLTFVGGELPLCLGISDEFQSRNLRIIGVDSLASRLESSKAFAKDFMTRHGIPTARYKIADSISQARKILESGFFQEDSVVIKADGLAGGKGVIVAENKDEAVEALENLEMIAGKDATKRIVLEERLIGKEVSQIIFSDGQHFALMPPVRDHKRLLDGDRGPNTGGMGTIAEWNLLSETQRDEIIERIIKPTLLGCQKDGFQLKGILFLGLMLTKDGAKVLEYNVRFGDPETQVILPLLETDLLEISEAILAGELDKVEIKWKPASAACVILASEGYPQKAKTGQKIFGLHELSNLSDVMVFHAGTSRDSEGDLVTSGGRVLGITAIADNLQNALVNAYQAVSKVYFNGMQFRRDIGIS